MEEPPEKQKFGLLKCPFALREEVIRNMEFMDAFHFSTLSKRSKQLVRNARYQTFRITFCFEEKSSKDNIEMEIKKGERLKISLSDLNVPPKRGSSSLDGLKLANLINEPSDDYRKKLSAHLLFIFHFKEISVQIGRNIKHVEDLFLWSITKQFDTVGLMAQKKLHITPDYLQFVLNATNAKEYFLDFRMNDLNFKYQLKDCESLDVSGSIQCLDTDGILQRNPKMKELHLEELPGEQINDLLKQWINGEVNDLEVLAFFNWDGYSNEVILDGIVTMKTKLTEEQARRMFGLWDASSRAVDIQRKIDGQLAAVHINQSGCFVSMCNKLLAEL
ncbi:hypothetical protein B9Z55_015572 [Caenorhabditis nigoni]|uniref:F-box domain-containing protein n=1 Tax=Caenorhabditis nigoni TaxID=1611254 RepID=A0A2G5UAT6_9PELO|nr:hypothetical protein B9Z55_015572 [Caenorhabditis nigoni]